MAGNSQSLDRSNLLYYQNPSGWFVALAYTFQPVSQFTVGRAEVKDHDLVLTDIDIFPQRPLQSLQLDSIERAQEDTELHVVAIAHKGFKDAVATLVIGYIICDEVSFSHVLFCPQRVVMPVYSGMSPASHFAKSLACSRRMDRQEHR